MNISTAPCVAAPATLTKRHIPRCLDTEQYRLQFKRLTPQAVTMVWRYLLTETGRTTDFSYGGLLIWAPLFDYEYAVYEDTLFIRGRMEGDMSRKAYSLPVGAMTLAESVSVLRKMHHGDELLRFSAIPEYALPEFEALHPLSITPQPDWDDYLYDIEPLATLAGRKMAKKRNHVNRFQTEHKNIELLPLTPERMKDALAVLEKSEISIEQTQMAVAEHTLCRNTLSQLAEYNMPMIGAILYADSAPVAFTIGDVKGDTLYIHIEKADRDVAGAYETVNKYFANYMWQAFPQLKYVNREDDAGQPGLRHAKESYHPACKLHKYDILLPVIP